MPLRKPRVLKKKNIRRKTGARSQSKQISALTTQMSKINAEQLQRIRAVWHRPSIPIGTLATATPYICPIPYNLCDPLGTSPVANSRFWTDSLAVAPFSKRMIFGYSDAAANSNKIYHTGSKIRYQIYTNEPSYTKIGMFLIRPKRAVADQLSVDRALRATTILSPYPGGSSFLTDDVDYTAHPGDGGAGVNTLFGSEINTKYWTILYKREIALTHPLASGFANNASANNSSPANNGLVASGTIKVPAGGVIMNVSQQTQVQGDKSATAFEAQYVDQSNEKSCYLVLIHNDVTLDNQTVDLGLVCTDYYKAVV